MACKVRDIPPKGFQELLRHVPELRGRGLVFVRVPQEDGAAIVVFMATRPMLEVLGLGEDWLAAIMDADKRRRREERKAARVVASAHRA